MKETDRKLIAFSWIMLIGLALFVGLLADQADQKRVLQEYNYQLTTSPTPNIDRVEVVKLDCNNGKEYLVYYRYGWHTYPDNQDFTEDKSWFGGIRCIEIKTDIVATIKY
jgi:hypothetical protein